jgi:translation initiation factor 3 subunit H
MMRCLREVNVDNNTVGWYQSTYLGSYLNESMIETQYNYQVTIPKCVVVVFDPLRSSHGALSLKALRLTEAFMALYKDKVFTQER